MRKKKHNRGSTVDIIKSNNTVRDQLQKRIKAELKISDTDICKDALNLKYQISGQTLSNYWNRDYPFPNRLCQESILWLCVRYGIRLSITSKVIKYSREDNVKYLKKFWLSTPTFKYYERIKSVKEVYLRGRHIDIK